MIPMTRFSTVGCSCKIISSMKWDNQKTSTLLTFTSFHPTMQKVTFVSTTSKVFQFSSKMTADSSWYHSFTHNDRISRRARTIVCQRSLLFVFNLDSSHCLFHGLVIACRIISKSVFSKGDSLIRLT